MAEIKTLNEHGDRSVRFSFLLRASTTTCKRFICFYSACSDLESCLVLFASSVYSCLYLHIRQVQRRAATIALDLFNVTVTQAQLDSKVATFAYNLFGLAKRSGAAESYLRSSLAATAAGPSPLHRSLAQKLQA